MIAFRLKLAKQFSKTASTLALAVALAFALTACGSDSQKSIDHVQGEACTSRMQARFDQDKAAQLAWYQGHGGVLPSPSQQPRLVPGTNGRAVVVVHGFISSPYFMNDIAEPLIREGYTVVMPLLTGYGSGAVAANASTLEDWRVALEKAVAVAKTCTSDVSIISHSLGAALTADAIENLNMTGISKVVLLAPFFSTSSAWPTVLAGVLPASTEVVDMSTFRSMTGGMDPYKLLPIPRNPEGEPEPFLPVKAMKQVLKLQSTFAIPPRAKVTSPTLIVVSEADGVVDSGYALKHAKENFSPLDILVYEQALDIGHSFQVRERNPRMDELNAKISEHLRK